MWQPGSHHLFLKPGEKKPSRDSNQRPVAFTWAFINQKYMLLQTTDLLLSLSCVVLPVQPNVSKLNLKRASNISSGEYGCRDDGACCSPQAQNWVFISIMYLIPYYQEYEFHIFYWNIPRSWTNASPLHITAGKSEKVTCETCCCECCEVAALLRSKLEDPCVSLCWVKD